MIRLVCSAMEHEQRQRIIGKLSSRLGAVLGRLERPTSEEVAEKYRNLFLGMSNKELLRVKLRMSECTDAQLRTVDNQIDNALSIYPSSSLRSKYACFLFDTTIWTLFFSESYMNDRLVYKIMKNGCCNFFYSLSGVMPESILESDLWLNYSLGYMVERMVTFQNQGSVSDLDNMLWIGQNIKALEPHRGIITERRDITRGFCEALLSNASPALVDGVL